MAKIHVISKKYGWAVKREGSKYDMSTHSTQEEAIDVGRESAKAEEDLVWVLQSAKHKPSPIDGYFGAVYYIGPIFTAFRGTPEATEYYRVLKKEIEQRIAEGKGPITPDGELTDEKYRLVVEGPPNWTSFREFWKMFYDEGAVVVASTYAKVGGVYDFGFRHESQSDLPSNGAKLDLPYINAGDVFLAKNLARDR
jgi:bcr-type benzoyl-CoA reductase subunit B